MDKKNLAFDRSNFILLAVGMLIVIIGFILMSGGQSDNSHFDPSVFSTMRIKIAPVICFIGYVSMIYAVAHRPKDAVEEKTDNQKEMTSAENAGNGVDDKDETIINTHKA